MFLLSLSSSSNLLRQQSLISFKTYSIYYADPAQLLNMIGWLILHKMSWMMWNNWISLFHHVCCLWEDIAIPQLLLSCCLAYPDGAKDEEMSCFKRESRHGWVTTNGKKNIVYVFILHYIKLRPIYETICPCPEGLCIYLVLHIINQVFFAYYH